MNSHGFYSLGAHSLTGEQNYQKDTVPQVPQLGNYMTDPQSVWDTKGKGIQKVTLKLITFYPFLLDIFAGYKNNTYSLQEIWKAQQRHQKETTILIAKHNH